MAVAFLPYQPNMYAPSYHAAGPSYATYANQLPPDTYDRYEPTDSGPRYGAPSIEQVYHFNQGGQPQPQQPVQYNYRYEQQRQHQHPQHHPGHQQHPQHQGLSQERGVSHGIGGGAYQADMMHFGSQMVHSLCSSSDEDDIYEEEDGYDHESGFAPYEDAAYKQDATYQDAASETSSEDDSGEFRVTPNMDTPCQKTRLLCHEQYKRPSGIVHTTQTNQAVEFWVGVANMPRA